MLLTIVIPAHNSEDTIGLLVEQLFSLYGRDPIEVVVVDDGSRDRTAGVAAEAARRFEGRVVFVQLARNFGEHNAVMAGLCHSRGDWVVVMDDDFQNPPSAVAALVGAMRAGDYDVVYSYYEKKMHPGWRRFGSWLNNLFATLLIDKPYGLYLSSFKIMSRFAVDQITNYSGPYPYIDGLLLQSVGRIGTVAVPHEARAGKSSYSVRALLRLWLNTFTNFSVLPLRIAFALGIAAFLGGMGIVLSTFYERLTEPDVPVGYASLMTVLLVFSGLILMVSGLIGEYVGRILLNINGKPQFVVRDVSGGEGRERLRLAETPRPEHADRR